MSRGHLLQDSAHLDQSSSIRSELWCLPMSAILDHSLQRAAGHQESRLHGRCMRHAILSFSLASLSLSPSTPYPATCGVSFFLLLSLALSHTPVDLLGGGSDRCTRQVFGQCAAPDFNLISDEIEVRFSKTDFRCHEIYFILLLCFELHLKKFHCSYPLSKFFLGNFLLISEKKNLQISLSK